MTSTPSPAPSAAPPATGRAAAAVGLTKVYGHGDTSVVALDQSAVEFRRGQFTAIMGPSGSGKSTLMHCLAGLDDATRAVFLGDTDLTSLDDKQLTLLRRDAVGFVFQAFNLVPTLTALENITLPLDSRAASPTGVAGHRRRHLGLRDRLTHRPSELSGGQQQRVAFAARWPASPRSSSPTSPPATSTRSRRRDAQLPAPGRRRTCDQTIVMVTHDPIAAAYADRVVFLADGRIVDEMLEPTADPCSTG